MDSPSPIDQESSRIAKKYFTKSPRGHQEVSFDNEGFRDLESLEEEKKSYRFRDNKHRTVNKKIKIKKSIKISNSARFLWVRPEMDNQMARDSSDYPQEPE